MNFQVLSNYDHYEHRHHAGRGRLNFLPNRRFIQVEKMTVKDLMTPKDQYVTFSDSSTLYEAVMQINKQQKEMGELAHTTILVKDDSGKIISHLNIFDVMRGIEPKYREVSGLSRFGVSQGMVEQIFKESDPWTFPLKELCSKAPQILIRDIMLKFSQAETIPINDDLNRAIHKIVVNQLHSLMVLGESNEIVGILRSIDLFDLIRSQIEKCQMDQS